MREPSARVKSENAIFYVDPRSFRHYVESVYITKQMVLGEDDDGRRADRILRKSLKNLSLSTIYRLFREGDVRVEQHSIQPGARLKKGAVLEVSLPEDLNQECQKRPANSTGTWKGGAAPQKARAEARNHVVPWIVWQNQHLVAFHKPRGMLVHDGAESLTAYALGLLSNTLSPSLSFTPGPLHRLDRNTSGLVMFSKTRIGAEKFTEALRSRQIRKFYIAIVQGGVATALQFHDKLLRDEQKRISKVDSRGRDASLSLLPIRASDGYSLVLIELYTGLTHQIRAQCAAHGIPLAADSKYGGRKTPEVGDYYLHSYCLYLREALFEDMPSKIIDPLPESFNKAVAGLFGVEAERNIDGEILKGIGQLLKT